MRALYRAGFRVGVAPEVPASLDAVAALCLDWAFYRPTIQDPPPPATHAASFDEKQVGDNTFIGAMLVENDGEKAWGLRLTHADSEDANLRWVTEIGLLQGVDGQIDFSCSNLVGNVNGTVSPLRRPATRPRLVRDLLLRFGGRGSRPLSAAPTVLVNEPGSLRDFLDFLHDPKRRHPIVMISATNMHDRPVVDPDDVASSLAGLAHVYVARNRYPSLTLREHLPRSLNCWDGAIRIYWPGFKPTDSPFHHRVWSARTVTDIEEMPGRSFREYLLARIAQFAVFNVHERFLTWSDLEGRRRQVLLKSLAEKGYNKELFDEYEQENLRLSQFNRELQEQIRAAKDELERVRNQAESWRAAYHELSKSAGASAITEIETPVDSVADAVSRATQEFGDKLVFALNSKSDAESNPFEEPEEVLSALQFLATTYRDAKLGITPCRDLDQALREINGWFYQGGQSDITMRTYSAWYQCRWNGEIFWAGEHIGTGTNKDPRYTIRIAFAWEPKQKKVIIGFIGQHQRTGAT